jgi:hypothetical protein
MNQYRLWHLCGIVLFLALTAVHRRVRSSGVLILVIWNLAGVILHETAHLVVGALLGAQPAGISLLPRREGRGWRLGSVSFRHVTPFNAVPVALAPLGLAGVAYWLAQHWFNWQTPSFASTMALYGCVFVLLSGSLPSRQDLRVACNWRSLLLYVPLAAALTAYFIRADIP